VPVHSPT